MIVIQYCQSPGEHADRGGGEAEGSRDDSQHERTTQGTGGEPAHPLKSL